MREYVAAVIKAHEEHDAAHAKETEAQREVIKTSDPKDPDVCLLEATHWAAHPSREGRGCLPLED